MLRWIKWIAALMAGLLGVAVFGVWLVLSSSMLAKTRGDMTAQLLTSKLGQVVEITGGVVVDLGSVLHVSVEGLALPSQTMANISLAEIGQLEFDVALHDLLKGRIDLLDIQVAGAKLALVVDEEGTSSWSPAKAKTPGVTPDANPSPGSSKGKNGNVVDFLAGHRIGFSNADVMYTDARNGLDLDLLLTSLDLSQKESSAPVVLHGAGTLNGQELSLNGNFPQNQPFKVTVAFSQINAVLDVTPDKGGYDAGYTAAIALEIAELGQLLDVLKLEKPIAGTGHVNAVFKKSPESARIEDLDLLVTLDGGQSLELTGELGELGDPTDITLDTIIRLYSEANRPAPTLSRRELKLIAVDMRIAAQPDGISQRRMVIETNGFVLDTSGVGPPPISFSEISRTADGQLKIGKLVLRLGPPEAHFVVLEGVVADALRLEGIDIEGTLDLPMASVLAPEFFQTSDVLGNVTGGFRLSGNKEELGLSDLVAVSRGTDLWNLNVSGSIKNALRFDDVVLNIAADVPSGADFLDALDLEPIKTGPVKLSTKVSSQGTEWVSELTVAVAQSQLDLRVDLDADEPNPTLRGRIESDLIRVEHLRDIVAASVQLAKLNDLEKAASQQSAAADGRSESLNGKIEEPLVLAKPEKADPAGSEKPDGTSESADGKIVEQLVLAKPEKVDAAGVDDSGGTALASADASQQSGPFRKVTLQPLGQAILLSGMDLNVTIDLRKIEGEKGSTSLKSDLEMKGNKARLGPLKFEYGDAHFDITGSMDLDENPDTVKLSGSTGGWNFGKIMHELRFKKGASGVLNASFDVSGSHASARDFLATLDGTANVSMRNGSIDSQLLDLAGLGVIPWLFSKDRGAAVTIVCARAPLQISNGRISSKQVVVETDQVQIVVFGNVDLKRKTLDISGQPRRIGKPLSRSPWPFTAVGPIAKPKIKVKDGPRRLRRSDGASTMPQRRKICVPDILQLK